MTTHNGGMMPPPNQSGINSGARPGHNEIPTAQAKAIGTSSPRITAPPMAGPSVTRICQRRMASATTVIPTLEQRLRTIVRADLEKRWVEENRAAIDSINTFIDRHGLLAGRLRLRSDRP